MKGIRYVTIQAGSRLIQYLEQEQNQDGNVPGFDDVESDWFKVNLLKEWFTRTPEESAKKHHEWDETFGPEFAERHAVVSVDVVSSDDSHAFGVVLAIVGYMSPDGTYTGKS